MAKIKLLEMELLERNQNMNFVNQYVVPNPTSVCH